MLRDGLFSYEVHEKEIFVKHMPTWYAYYEYNILIKIIRIFLGLWLLFSTRILPTYLELHIQIEDNLVFILFYLIIMFFFICIVSLKFVLRFVYMNQLLRNSPFSVKNCIFFCN